MSKRVTFIEILALILIIGLSILALLNGSVRNYPKDKTIIAFGDSLTRGYGVVAPDKNFVVYLSEYVKIPIINAGKSGDTTSDALIRLKGDILDKKPDIVIVLLGGNDFLDGISEEVVGVNLKTIIKNIKKINSKVILIGGGKDVVPKFEQVIEKVALEEGVDGYVPNVLRGILLRKDLRFDDIHPNERGHKIIADRILPVLEKVLSGLK